MVVVSAGLAVIDHGFRPLSGYIALNLGATAFHIGLLATVFAAGALLLAVPAGRIIDRYGAGKVLALSCSLLPLSIIATLFVKSIFQLLLVALASGCVHIFVALSSQAAVVRGQKEYQLDSIFGWLSAGTSVGQVAGPLLVLAVPDLLPGNTITVGLWLLSGLSLIVALIAVVSGLRVAKHSGPPPPRQKNTPVIKILRTPDLAVVVLLSGITLACLDLMVVFLPLWAEERNIAPTAVASLLAVRGTMSLASRLVMHLLVRQFSRKHVVTVSLLIGGLGMTLLPFVGVQPAYILMAFFGFCLGLVQPLTITWVVSAVAAHDRGAALGLRMLTNRLMQVSMPIIVGLISLPLGSIGSASTRSLVLSAMALLTGSAISAKTSWKTNNKG